MMGTSERLESEAKRKPVWTLVRIVFGSAGLAFALFALRGAWDEVDLFDWNAGAALAAIGCVVLTTLMGARVWATLRPVESSRVSRLGYYSALIGKYIPGGIFQAAGQVGYAARDGATVRHAVGTLVLSMLTTAAAASVLVGSIVLIDEHSVWLRLAGVATVMLGAVLSRRRFIAAVQRRIQRLTGRNALGASLPSQHDLTKSVLWALMGLALLGASFAIVARQLAADLPLGASFAGFAVAWLLGFLALPFPAGIGIREAALIWLLSPWVGTATVVAISLGHRVITVIGEVTVFAATRVSMKRRSAEGG